MAISKFARTTLISTIATLALSGATMAATADITGTGPDSVNTISSDVSNHVEISNQNNVTVNNNNTQYATTGDAKVSGNTTGGDATVGDASNSNTASTTIQIGNQSVTGPCGCGQGGNTGGSGDGVTPIAGGGSTQKGVGAGSLSVGAGMLPETGASLPVDVSALRNLLNPTSQSTPLSAVVKANGAVSTIVLVVAAILSLLGAIGTAVYSTKRTLRV